VNRAPLAAAGLALSMAALPAAAQDAIRLDIPDCAGVPSATVRELVALEVAPRTVLEADSQAEASTSGGLRCRAGVAQIWVDDQRLAAPLRLEITLTDLAPQARPRLLALALSELIATSRLEKSQLTAADESVEPQSTAAVADADEPEDAASPAVPVSVQIWLGVGAAREADPLLIAPSIAAGGVVAWDQLALAADLRFDRGARTEPAAELTLNAISLALGPAWRVHGSSSQLLLGAAVRAGYAGLSARARSPDTTSDSLSGFWLGPCAQAALQLRITERWTVRAGLELGYVTQTVRGLDARGQALLDLGGLWVSGHAGVSWDATDSGS
jgi:hypothetical protein